MMTFGEPSVAQASVILSTGRGETMSISQCAPHCHRTWLTYMYTTLVTTCPTRVQLVTSIEQWLSLYAADKAKIRRTLVIRRRA